MALWRAKETKKQHTFGRTLGRHQERTILTSLCLSKGQQPPSNLRWYSSWQRGTQLSKVAVCTTKLSATVTIGASPVELLALLDPNLMLGHQGHTILRLLLPASPDHRLSSTNSISKPTTKQLSNRIIYPWLMEHPAKMHAMSCTKIVMSIPPFQSMPPAASSSCNHTCAMLRDL